MLIEVEFWCRDSDEGSYPWLLEYRSRVDGGSWGYSLIARPAIENTWWAE